MTSNQRTTVTKNSRHTKMAWLISLVVFAAFVTGLAVYDYNKLNANAIHPTDLGTQLEYIGKHKFRCYFGGLLCDSGAYSEYYFATDMTEDQVKEYFRRATFIGSTDGGGYDFTFHELSFRTFGNQGFAVTYYHDIKPDQIDSGLKNTTKPYGISITDEDFRIAQSAL